MQVQRVQNNNYKTNFTFSSLTLKNEIAKLKNPTKEMVQDMYGTFGLDIFQGKEHLTILTDKEFKKSKSFITKIVNSITEQELFDYKEVDTLTDIINKYIRNKKIGFVKDIENMFGRRGLEKLKDPDVYIFTFNSNGDTRFINLHD